MRFAFVLEHSGYGTARLVTVATASGFSAVTLALIVVPSKERVHWFVIELLILVLHCSSPCPYFLSILECALSCESHFLGSMSSQGCQAIRAHSRLL